MEMEIDKQTEQVPCADWVLDVKTNTTKRVSELVVRFKGEGVYDNG
jgi:hypothetical protein